MSGDGALLILIGVMISRPSLVAFTFFIFLCLDAPTRVCSIVFIPIPDPFFFFFTLLQRYLFIPLVPVAYSFFKGTLGFSLLDSILYNYLA